MRKHLSSIVLLVILLIPASLAVLSSINIAAAAGNVTINDFTCNVTKGTVPFQARLTGNVTGEVTKWLWEFYNPKLIIGLTALETELQVTRSEEQELMEFLMLHW